MDSFPCYHVTECMKICFSQCFGYFGAVGVIRHGNLLSSAYCNSSSACRSEVRGILFFCNFDGRVVYPPPGTMLLQSTARHKPATHPSPPPSCCAPIKAELIKPQLIVSAGEERWMREGLGEVGVPFHLTALFTILHSVGGHSSMHMLPVLLLLSARSSAYSKFDVR